MNVVHIDAVSKNAADDKLRQNIRRFADIYSPPASIVLISSKLIFYQVNFVIRRLNSLLVDSRNMRSEFSLELLVVWVKMDWPVQNYGITEFNRFILVYHQIYS